MSSNVSANPIIEPSTEATREKKSEIEKAYVTDDVHSKQSSGDESEIEFISRKIEFIRSIRGSEPMLDIAERIDESTLASILIGGSQGEFVFPYTKLVVKLLGCFELVDEVVTPFLISESNGLEPKLMDSMKTIEEVKIPFEIEQESKQPSNKKEEVNEKKKRKRGQSGSVVDDSWLPAGWKKIERYRKNGKLRGHIDKSYKAPGVRRTFRSKKQALEFIRKQKFIEANRGEKSLEDVIRETQVANGIQTVSINIAGQT